ncbi:hypothetical protein VOLCADRAFT_102693 [Volvox carteri f. nagariensis]|uniref:FAD-binding domain-containing protein n=1 Tax=Volvox carteri f. nagariensis TaxID=3068 RepID=D8THH3_VOLCA|nr:uncharacterized protein VOLCADRAFT_102693 [Volvox carteri f. nagariensis]EFJ52711.1 hypothetical protein VOLCADRAFT_102693 [Volvox carteri f. nagariensis]|eukprot:XP_002945716.1 hypothetical protein VOLCADRAFT_102693 [Volvox carteri f. nagariensis]
MGPPPHEVEVAIIGAGLGGLALAAGLHRRGLAAHVFEASSELRKETSTMVGLGPNALAALGDLHPDLPEQIRRRGVVNANAVYSYFPPGRDPVIIERLASETRLHTIRWAQVVPPEFVHCNHAATGYDEIWDEQGMDNGTDVDESATATTAMASSPSAVRPAHRAVVHFRDQPSVTAKLVVGADGVFSPIRAAMYPNDPGPRYLGHMNWNCLIYNPGGNTVAHAHEPGQLCIANNGLLGAELIDPSLFAIVCDAGGGYTFWQVRMRYDEPCFTSQLAQPPPREANGTGAAGAATGGAPNGDSDASGSGGARRGRGGQGVPGSKARVIERLQSAGWHWWLPLVEATPESAIFERALYDRVPLERWASSGRRVVLLGDAAHAMHPMAGQGARSAFEDAHQLTLALEEFWADVPTALERYQKTRIYRHG